MDASIPHDHQYFSYNNNYPSFSADFFGLSTPVADASGKLDAIGDQNVINMVPSIQNYNGMMNSPMASSQFGVLSDDCKIVVPQMSSEFDFGFSDNFAVSDYSTQLHQVFEPGEECCGLVPNFCPAYNPIPAAENWGIIQGKPANKVDVDDMKEVKVGKYSVEEKKNRILRYLKKRNQRNFNKTIKYACRKTLADKRVRIRGRFAKNNESCSEEETAMNTISDDTRDYEENNNSVYNEEDSFLQVKYDEDYWFDEAEMANLVHLPYF